MNSTEIKNTKSSMIINKPFTPPNHNHQCHRRRRRRHRDQSIPHLPKEILQEILNRVSLPIKTILEFQTSRKCKVFSSIFSDSKFVESQTRNYTLPCVLACDGDRNTLFLVEGQNGKFLSTEINMDFVSDNVTAATKDMEIMSSCNGLLLLSDHSRILRVVNPLTREIVTLPSQAKGDKSYYVMGYSTKSEKHKVVRLVGCISNTVGGYYFEFSWYAEVLTLGCNTWRRVNGCDHVLQNATIEHEGQVMMNGALYWLIHLGNKQEIVGFVIDSEEFELISSPLDEVGLRSYNCSMTSLGVVDGMLSVTLYDRGSRGLCNNFDLSRGMEIWVWRDCSVWTVWKKINVSYVDNMWFVRRFDLINVCENDEEVLMMLHDPFKLVYYDTNKHTIREAQIDGVDCKNRMEGVVFCPNLRSIGQCIHVEG